MSRSFVRLTNLSQHLTTFKPQATSIKREMSSEGKVTRLPFIGGNWKCNGTKASVDGLVQALNAAKLVQAEVVVSPAALHLQTVASTIGNNIQVSAQNCSRTANGAYTGEISAEMLIDFGIKWVILGHSERRQYYNEVDQVVGEKVAIAQKAGLSVIACIGETIEERKAEKTLEVVFRQLKAVAAHTQDWGRMVLAYEPVWAIGTGLTATPQQAQDVHAEIRKWLGENVNKEVATKTRIIYGGSVKTDNCNTLMSEKDIDGFLVGGASLKASDFITIVNAAQVKL